jgi:hypothetical protein
MKNFDSLNGREMRTWFAFGLTRVPPLWNHPKTVAPHFASKQDFLNLGPERRNFWGCFFVT